MLDIWPTSSSLSLPYSASYPNIFAFGSLRTLFSRKKRTHHSRSLANARVRPTSAWKDVKHYCLNSPSAVCPALTYAPGKRWSFEIAMINANLFTYFHSNESTSLHCIVQKLFNNNSIPASFEGFAIVAFLSILNLHPFYQTDREFVTDVRSFDEQWWPTEARSEANSPRPSPLPTSGSRVSHVTASAIVAKFRDNSSFSCLNLWGRPMRQFLEFISDWTHPIVDSQRCYRRKGHSEILGLDPWNILRRQRNLNHTK